MHLHVGMLKCAHYISLEYDTVRLTEAFLDWYHSGMGTWWLNILRGIHFLASASHSMELRSGKLWWMSIPSVLHRPRDQPLSSEPWVKGKEKDALWRKFREMVVISDFMITDGAVTWFRWHDRKCGIVFVSTAVVSGHRQVHRLRQFLSSQLIHQQHLNKSQHCWPPTESSKSTHLVNHEHAVEWRKVDTGNRKTL